MTKKVNIQKHVERVYQTLQPIEESTSLKEALKMTLMHLYYESEPPALLLSGGLDSQALLFTLLELDIKPITYTFHLEGVESRDLKRARATAEAFGVEHRIVTLPKDPESILRFVRFLQKYTTNTSKAFTTCMWASVSTMRQIYRDGLTHMVMGLSSDIYFAMSRKWGQVARYKDIPLQDIFIPALRNLDQQIIFLKCMGAQLGITLEHPYESSPYLARMVGQGFKYNDANKPREKWLLRKEFLPQLEKAKTGVHQGYQLGDTQIGAYFEKVILESRINIRGYKSVAHVLKYVYDHPAVWDGGDPEKSNLFSNTI